MSRTTADSPYNEWYFANRCGVPYSRNEHWLSFFGRIADRIVEQINPTSVLDAGCAMGFLVEALRARGVDAYGVDVSEYALSMVRDDIKPYCERRSVSERLTRHYDLIVCIEVLEHLESSEAGAALTNFCAHSDAVLLSASAVDRDEPTHVTVESPDRWAARLAKLAFLPDADFDASVITPWAMLFRRDISARDSAAAAERVRWRLTQAVSARDERLSAAEREIALLQQRIRELEGANSRLASVEAELSRTARELAAIHGTRTFRYTRGLRSIYARLRWKGSEAVHSATEGGEDVRRALASRYLGGSGIEIGPLHRPLALPVGTRVRYVDRMSVEELRAHYPELGGETLVPPDVIDDGEELATFDDATLDFVVANHFIEHCENPIATLENHLRVLREGAVLFMAVPDKRSTFDSARPLTSVEHLVRDYTEGPEWSRIEHFEEYARLVNRIEPYDEHARYLMGKGYSIHYHVWTPDSFLKLLRWCQTTAGLPFTLEEIEPDDTEFVVVLRKAAVADRSERARM